MNPKTKVQCQIALFAGIIAIASCSIGSVSTAEKPVAAQRAETEPHERVLKVLRGPAGVVVDRTLTEALPNLHPKQMAFNPEAPIPPQCYTDTAGAFNPCYVCHQDIVPNRENQMSDGSLQLEYAFSDVGMTNHWQNLFEDRSAAVAEISDEEIIDWVDTDNYSALAPRLRAAEFGGWIPDLKNLHLGAAAFDAEGFAKDGSGWIAFNYKPLPSTFWPTNGSTDDVLIRLPTEFQQNRDGDYSADVYKANLAILEARIKGFEEIGSLPLDEQQVGVDLNGDGALGTIRTITQVDRYVGAAGKRFNGSYLYPEGTEFLHTVRYVGVSDADAVYVPQRMKEVRYMRKWVEYGKAAYARQYELENFGKELGRLPRYQLIGDRGLDNGFGWSVQGFIEDAHGELRTLTYEENQFCMGCHSSIGATIDKTFAFPRKVDGAAGWTYIDLRGMPDAPNMGEQKGEIATYLERVGGGGEFRSNPEMVQRWFHKDGRVNHSAVSKADVYALITPSRERALELNKAYRVIVAEQDYIYGRNATVTPPQNVLQFIDNDTAPTLGEELFQRWDIRLDWKQNAVKTSSLANLNSTVSTSASNLHRIEINRSQDLNTSRGN